MNVRRVLAAVAVMTTLAAFLACGCGKEDKPSPFLESERRLEGMYEECKTIEISDPLGERPEIDVDEVREMPMVIVGDSLFQFSIGRTDFPGASHELLIKSIKEKLIPLGEDCEVYPGHGPPTIIGRESKYNPFLQEDGTVGGGSGLIIPP